MNKFPTDVPREKALKVLEFLGFHLLREGNHIAMVRQNTDVRNRVRSLVLAFSPICDPLRPTIGERIKRGLLVGPLLRSRASRRMGKK